MTTKNKGQKKLWKANKLICGDNLEEIPKLPKKSVDLIYIDPPFFTHKQYEVVWKDEAETRSYEDRWEGGIEHFIGWLKPRVQAMYEVLKPTGSFYLHCDWHANAHIRIMLDEIFGSENFQNEIIWWYGGGGASKTRFGRKHDTIYFYSKNKNKKTFNVDSVREPYKWTAGQKRADGSKRDYSRGKIPDDVWNIHGIMPWSKEKQGYPTQKPEALLKRIIEASSNKNDVVADFFCGCGTTIAVAQQLGRKWIGIDISPTAIKVIQSRLGKGREGTLGLGIKEGVHYIVIGMPNTIKEVRKLKPFEFQNWVIIDKMRATASRKKVGDMGLDGYYPRSVLTEEAGIQVKQSDKVGRNVVDNFETALKRAKYKKGYIVAFSFSKGAYEEAARAKNKEGLEIKLITVKGLLEKKKPIT